MKWQPALVNIIDLQGCAALTCRARTSPQVSGGPLRANQRWQTRSVAAEASFACCSWNYIHGCRKNQAVRLLALEVRKRAPPPPRWCPELSRSVAPSTAAPWADCLHACLHQLGDFIAGATLVNMRCRTYCKHALCPFRMAAGPAPAAGRATIGRAASFSVWLVWSAPIIIILMD